jgi:hypothetical protein
MKVETLGLYILEYKSDDCIDIQYKQDGDKIVLLEDFQSVSPSIISLRFLKEPIINNKALIVSKNGKYGLIYEGQLVLECIYDEIRVINARTSHDKSEGLNSAPTAVDTWYMLRIGEMEGVFSTSGVKTEIVYGYVDVIDWKTYHSDIDYDGPRYFVLELESKWYSADKKMTRICENDSMSFEGFVDSFKLVFCAADGNFDFYNHTGIRMETNAYDDDGYKLDAYDPDKLKLIEYAVASWPGEIVDLTKEKYVYVPKTNMVELNPYYEGIEVDEEEEYDEKESRGYYWRKPDPDDYPDDTDYERETFYTLGGYDYDEWKERGGNIDDMMDGMGF